MNTFSIYFISSIACFMMSSTLNDSRAAEKGEGRTAPTVTCKSILPADARRVENFKLCKLPHHGKKQVYACQNFVSSEGRFRVYFQGGRFPRAMASITGEGNVEDLHWFESKSTKQEEQPTCNVQAPAPVPATARFIGVGVCEEESGDLAPCSAFRNKAPRLKYISDYVVLYTGPGRSHLKVWSKRIAINKDAMLAEMVYQIGLSLVDTQCCHDRGVKYIEQASSLYPGETLYRETYRKIVQQAPGRGKHRPRYYANEAN